MFTLEPLEDRCLYSGFSLSDAIARGVDARPDFIVMADFNRDARLDVVTSSYDSSSLTILLGKSGGAFVKPKVIAMQSPPDHVMAADLNGDSCVDLVTVSFEQKKVTVLLGDGRGNFSASDYSTGVGCRAAVLCNADHDGFADLVLASPYDERVTILHGNGDGTFAAAVQQDLDFTPTDLAPIDADSDGLTDFLAIDFAHDSAHLLNDSGAASQSIPGATGAGPSSIAVGTFNQDNKPDFVTANFLAGSISIFLSSGSGFNAPIEFVTGAGATYVACADLDLDGATDIVVANANDDSISLLKGNGSGGFEAPLRRDAGASPRSLAIGDLNKDGFPDIAVANQDQSVISVYSSDFVAPTAAINSAPSLNVSGGTSYTFSLRYTDNFTIDHTTADNDDILVSGPGGFSQMAQFVSATSDSDAQITATYRVQAPHSFWTPADNGTYSLSLQADQVFDAGADAAAAGTLGSFTVAARDAGNTFDAATGLGKLAPGNVKTVDDSIATNDRYDVFQFALTKSARMYGKLSGLSADADLQLFDASSKRIAYSKRSGTASEVFDMNLAPGTYWTRVLFGKQTSGSGYRLRFQADNPTPSPSRDHTLKLAKNLGTLAPGMPLTFNDYIGTDDSTDFLRFKLNQPGSLQLKLTGLSDNADLALLDSTGKVLGTSSRTGVSNETLTRSVAAGTYYARITFARGVRWTLYALRLSAN